MPKPLMQNPADIDEMLRRLGQTSDPFTSTSPFGPRPGASGAATGGLFEMANGAMQPALQTLANDPTVKLAKAKPGEAAAGPKAEPAQAQQPAAAPSGPGFFGDLASQVKPGMGRAEVPAASSNPFAQASAPQLGAFTPAAMPAKTPFEPVAVPGAVRTGMFNPGGSSPWDRSMTASSPEEELRLRQDAKYNGVLDLIRPGGIGMPGTTGPVIGLQPWEVQAMANLGGRQAGDLTAGRQIASGESVADADRMLKLLQGNQTTQSARDVANLHSQTDIQKANIEAQSRNNPNTIKLQLAGQYLAANRDPLGLGEFLGSLARHVPGANGSLPGADKGVDTDPVAGGPNLRASQAIGGVKPNFGTATPEGGFKLDPSLMKPENLKKLIDTIDSLPDDAKAAAARQIHRGDLGPANDVIDALAKDFANNSLLTERPPTDQGGSLPGQYGIVAGGGTDPLVTLNAMPAGSWLARRAQAVNGANNLPYNQITVGGRSMPFEPSPLVGNRATNLGIGQDQRRISAVQADKQARFLRQLIDMQKAQNQQPK
ncbi:MAG TPA: hypothetical protein VMZ71_05270 [Gemmataceae bacterium]|nr:hypothetical protein [Gemmataceae bacterium]